MREKGAPLFKHGFASRKERRLKSPKHKLFVVWQSMMWRCYRKTDNGYPNYGGRGIEVCQRWRESFQHFFEDMGFPPANHSIDRIDNNGNYEPSNCRWADPKQQANNMRVNRLLTVNGTTLTVAQWALKYGLTQARIVQRIDRLGWPVEKAVCTPARRQRNNHYPAI